MALTRKDAVATVLTGLVVLVYVAAREGWGVPLVGGSYRWAAAAIMLLGIATCAQGSPGRDGASMLLAVLGGAAVALSVIALVTGSPGALTALTVVVVALWAASTLRHVLRGSHRPVAA